MTHGRLSPFLRQRLLFLLAGNIALLAAMLIAFWVTGALRHGWRRPKGET